VFVEQEHRRVSDVDQLLDLPLGHRPTVGLREAVDTRLAEAVCLVADEHVE
jgi:hypothetical protein